jgi:hypothetical protein
MGCCTSQQPASTKGFRVKKIIRRRTAARNRRIRARLDKGNFPDDLSIPMMRGPGPRCELAGRSIGTVHGGLALARQLVRDLDLAQEIDQRLHLFKIHRPYHESDHVLNLAFSAYCGSRCLEDLELLRQDEAYLNLVGAARIPDPTTAGDFCRRFQQADLKDLQAAIDRARLKIWARQPASFVEEACIEADGTLVATAAESKQGIEYSYKGLWGYHPLVVTLAQTQEVLRIVNRSGNRPSHEGAAEQLDECIALCRQAGFRRILLRGDTDFSQTAHLDRWHEQRDVHFLFGFDCYPTLHVRADDLPETAWKPLKRPPKYVVRTQPRRKPEPVKGRLVEQHGFKDLQLVDEEVAEFRYQPTACRRAYRMIVVRKNLQIHDPAQGRLFDDYRYFFYLTNLEEKPAEQIVFSANDRCNQENVVAQLNSVRALHAPVNDLLSNGAYMLITSLAWNFKAWLALSLPELATPGAQQAQRRKEKSALLKMEFRTFVNSLVRLPAQILKTGRQLVVRLMGWNAWQPTFFRLADAFARPQRC